MNERRMKEEAEYENYATIFVTFSGNFLNFFVVECCGLSYEFGFFVVGENEQGTEGWMVDELRYINN